MFKPGLAFGNSEFSSSRILAELENTSLLAVANPAKMLQKEAHVGQNSKLRQHSERNVMAVPKVSVILMVMNGIPLLHECIQSVLAQTMADFEFIIIDDGSIDDTWNIINSYRDPRIRAFTQKNLGVAASANRGVTLARAPYVARIDHDDVMMPTRLEKELELLESNPQIALVGTYAQLIYGEKLSNDFYRAPVSSTALRLRLIFENPIVHPSIMMRTDVVREIGGYNEDHQFFRAEDFELWTRISRQHNLATIPHALIRYRIRPESASHSWKTIDHNILISTNNLYWYLKDRYTYDECHSLAGIFHRSAKPVAKLALRKALQMFDRVSDIIAGTRSKWDKETVQVYGLQRRMIFFHHILRRPPGSWFAHHVPALRLR